MSPINSSEHFNTDDAIAVVGMSCRLPKANSPEQFWQVLSRAQDCITPFPEGRPAAFRYGSTLSKESKMEGGFLKCPIDEFDASFFGISPREAVFMDPQQRILLEVTWEGLEDAGVNPLSLAETDTAVFVGIWTRDYDDMIPSEKLVENEVHYQYVGNALSATASRVSYFLGLCGPNVVLESGCSSSLSALHFACASLRQRESSIAIASGVNLILNPNGGPFSGKTDALVISKTHRCRTFDVSADGLVRAEGCGVVVLKRYADASEHGDNIHAIIRGSALNNDGHGASFGTPNRRAQERVIRSALANASVKPWDVSYVEAHGTGTKAGDPIEVEAIRNVYSENRTKPLMIGSVKSVIGHTESCAGIAGVIKVILCMKNNMLTPNLNLKTLNPKLQLDSIPATVPLLLTDWNDDVKIAGVSSFGMSGTNVHVLIQQHVPTKTEVPADADIKSQLIQISAKSAEALKELLKKYVDFVKTTNHSLESIAFGTNICRAKLPYRASFAATSKEELAAKIEEHLLSFQVNLSTNPKVAFLFTGQGCQYANMGAKLNSFPVFRNAFEECNILFQQKFNESLHKVIADEALLTRTIYSQSVLFCLQYSLLKLWNSLGVEPDVVLGHSIGEFAATVACGVYTLSDAFELVAERSRLIATCSNGAMLALRESVSEVEAAIEKFGYTSTNWIDITSVNSLEEVIVSAESGTIEEFKEFCHRLGIQFQPISASSPFHSRAMETIRGQFENFVSKFTSNAPSGATFISGTLADSMKNEEDFSPRYFGHHLRSTVQFGSAIKKLWRDGIRCFVEIGPKPILLSLATGNFGPESRNCTFCPSLRSGEDDIYSIMASCCKLFNSGVDIDTSGWYEGLSKEIASKLPKYPFQRQKYWYEDAENDAEINQLQLLALNQRSIVHPLLGQKIPMATNQPVFFNMISSSSLQLAYLAEHRVAGKTILPAAAYLEMFMASGREILHTTRHMVPFVVEDMRVEAALQLESPANVQTLVTPTSAGAGQSSSYTIGIYKEIQHESWKRHASATLRLATTTDKQGLKHMDFVDLKTRLDLKSPDRISSTYSAIFKLGIMFGPQFKSVKAAWSRQSGSGVELLTEMLPPVVAAEYVCHPIVLDFMIQTYTLSEMWSGIGNAVGKSLQLPVSIKKFTWFAAHVCTEVIYAYTTIQDTGDKDNPDGMEIFLFNDQGLPLACLEGLEVLATTEHSFLRSLKAYEQELPELYVNVWTRSPGVTETAVDLDIGTSDTTFQTEEGELAEAIHTIQAYENYAGVELRKINRAFTLGLVRSIIQCHWEVCVGKPLNVGTVRRQLPPHLQKTKFLESCLNRLRAEGYVNVVNGEFNVVKHFPSPVCITAYIEQLVTEASKVCKGDPLIEYTTRVTGHMTDVLSGKMSPLELLFPKNDVGADELYSQTKCLVLLDQIVVTYIARRIAQMGSLDPGQKIRILEVGAGTGATTARLLKRLKAIGTNLEYTFTDISLHFVNNARSRFGENNNLHFEVFNIEEDPLHQKFSPNYFDFILGFQVLHATRNLLETLGNLNILLRVGGALIFTEQFEDCPFVSLSFGFLESWWRFEDDRQISPVWNVSKWEDLLRETGYAHPETFQGFDGNIGAMCARKVQVTPYANVGADPLWIVFDDGSDFCQRATQKLAVLKRSVKVVQFRKRNESESEYLSLSELRLLFDKVLDAKVHFEGVLYFCTNNYTIFDVKIIQKLLCESFLHLWQVLASSSEKSQAMPRVCLVTRGVNSVGECEPASNPMVATLCGAIKSFHNEYSEFPVLVVDTDPSTLTYEIELEEIFSQLWTMTKPDAELFLAFRDGERYVKRVVLHRMLEDKVNLPQASSIIFLNSSTKISDLDFIPRAIPEPTNDQVVVEVRATAINFRDIFAILKPDGFENADGRPMHVGIDVSGTVISKGPGVDEFDIGNEVMGFAFLGGLGSHAVTSKYALIRKPKGLTFEAASTIPGVFVTAYYCLVSLAQISAKDRVLIHVATGGVGLAAIQVAKSFGAEVYATAGSRRKRAYLRSLGIEHIYYSRNTDFGRQISEDCKPDGITIVLNSLTGPGFKEASLSVCAKGACFIEIGKVKIWKPEEVEILRPDVKYFIVDVGELEYSSPKTVQCLLSAIRMGFDSGTFAILPHTTFPLVHIREAFHYFQEAKHIGKVVIQIPRWKLDKITGLMTWQHHCFDARGTYVITGGLGGVGMEVAQWMLFSGAVFVVLVGRNPPTVAAKNRIENWNQDGSSVMVFQADVSKYDNCVQLLEWIRKSFPPLRGIFHAAGTLSDGTLMAQTWEKFELTLASKVFGAWHLHLLTRDDPLDYFVLFSSIASVFGQIGQSNHAAANRFLDALAQYRIGLGLTATTINWGVWADVGAAAQLKLGLEGAQGIQAFAPEQGISAMQYILEHQLTQASVAYITDLDMLKKYIKLGRFFDALVSEPHDKNYDGLKNQAETDKLLHEIKHAEVVERGEKVQLYVESVLKRILQLSSNVRIPPDQNFSELGVDSLFTMELRNHLQMTLGESKSLLTLKSLQENRTLKSLSKHLMQLINDNS